MGFQKFLILVLVLCGFFYSGTHQLRAQEEDAIVELTKQVGALTQYVTRTFGLKENLPLTADDLRQAIIGGALWTKNAQESNGHFKYEYAPFENTYSEKDNVVRQAGTLYALAEVRRHTDKDAHDLNETIEKSIEYFESLSREGEWGDEEFRCVVRWESSSQCYLGATSLALLGILSYVEAKPNKITIEHEVMQ